VVAGLLRPGGRLFIREGHPVLWALSEPRPDGLLVLEHPCFETAGVRLTSEHSYVEHDEPLASPDTVEFNHGLAQTITALMGAGMRLTSLEEHDTCPWNALGDAMEELDNGECRLRDGPERLPATFTLQATKPGGPGVVG
jgi:hypothetical protein